MKFGIENYIFIAPFSLFFSLLLFFGTVQIGNHICKLSYIKPIFKNVADNTFLAPILGSSILIIFISPLTLLGFTETFFLRIIGILLCILSIFIIKDIFFQFKNNEYLSLPKIILFTYFILCFAPITSGDSLDYHTEVAIHILNYGSFPIDHFWFHSRQAGFGEILIALGLASGAEQYGSLIQFTGIFLVYGILKKQLSKFRETKKNLLTYALLSCPILIFLVATNKPQLMSSGLIALAFYIVFFEFRRLVNKKNKYIAFLITNIILILAYQIKFSSAVSIFLIWIYLMFEVYKSRLNIKIILSMLIILGVFLLLPYLHWKYHYLGGNYLQNLFYALPINLYGYSNLWESVSSCGYYCGFPIWFFFPLSIPQATQTLGISSILIFLSLFLKYINFKIKVIIILYIVIFLTFGQHNARFFIDPFFWSLIAFSKNLNNFKVFNKYKFISYSIYAQSLATFLMAFFGIVTLSIGSVNEELREKVLKKYGYNYELINWINKNLESDKVLLTFDSKNAYMKNKNISLFFFNYLDLNDTRSLKYFSEVARKNPSHILLVDPTDKEKRILVKNCLDKLIAKGDKIGSYSGRNPFKESYPKYNVKIYELKTNIFPDCLNINSKLIDNN